MQTRVLCWIAVVGLGVAPAWGQFDSGSDGSDGAFNPTESVEIDLSLAASLCDCDGDDEVDDPCEWACTSPVAGRGVYDTGQWAVVFKYTTINIPVGVTVTFANHPSGAPVVWLASGEVTISGTVSLNGERGAHSTESAYTYAEPGPGGFAGGLRYSEAGLPSGGFGPGGGHASTCSGRGGGGGGYGTAGTEGSGCGTGDGGVTYGNAQILPLIGGSGGGGGRWTQYRGGGGGAGGGAILIASSGSTVLNGMIRANGGGAGTTGGQGYGGGGSGGGIRLIANVVSGDGVMSADRGGTTSGGAGPGGYGRIRVEAADNTLSDPGIPNISESAATGPLFPPDDRPTLRVVAIDGEPVPLDPDAGNLTIDTPMSNPDPVTVQIEATNVPTDADVSVILVPARGDWSVQPAAGLSGDFSLSTTTAAVTFPPGRVEIQLRATWTP